ncbi:hypothetical protein OFAG_02149 [Oxalobacter formigenes HOxBLS]|uniref:Uncharacterized protein n=1 Tax=Oxalobacter paraformigenes TaxID=556268 RepID=T5LTB4_9BURK|nr:hypothetical protein OFAG_02149 [Oxalobacter paraformigenes]
MKKAGGWRSGKRFCDRPSRSKPYRRTVQDFSFSKPFTGLEKTRRCDRRSVLSGQRGERDKRANGGRPPSGKGKRKTAIRLTAFSGKRGSVSGQRNTRPPLAGPPPSPAFSPFRGKNRSPGKMHPSGAAPFFCAENALYCITFRLSPDLGFRWKRSVHFPALAGSRLTMATAPETSRTIMYCSLPPGPVSRYRLP